MITVKINDAMRQIARGTTIERLLADEGMPGRGIAVAVNGRVVPRGDHHTRVLEQGDNVIIIHAAYGG